MVQILLPQWKIQFLVQYWILGIHLSSIYLMGRSRNSAGSGPLSQHLLTVRGVLLPHRRCGGEPEGQDLWIRAGEMTRGGDQLSTVKLSLSLSPVTAHCLQANRSKTVVFPNCLSTYKYLQFGLLVHQVWNIYSLPLQKSFADPCSDLGQLKKLTTSLLMHCVCQHQLNEAETSTMYFIWDRTIGICLFKGHIDPIGNLQ